MEIQCIRIIPGLVFHLSAISTGVHLLPLSITLLIAAVGIPRYRPNASPRRVVRFGFLALFLGIAVMVAALDAGAGPEIVTWPMLLAGLGVGALASQLGSVTVSSVTDEETGDVGGLQNTITNLGASIGTALGGAILIGALTSAFLGGIQKNPDIPERISSSAQTELSAGIPFVSDSQLQSALNDAHVAPKTSDAIVSDYSEARLAGLRTSLSVLGVIALVAMFATRRIPDTQPAAQPESVEPAEVGVPGD